MKNILFITAFVLLLALASCSGNTRPANQAAPESPSTENKPTTASGQELFSSKCAVCHGADGTAGMGGAANLQTSTLDSTALLEKIENGGASMPAFKSSLSPEEIQRIGEYTKSLRK